MQIVKILAGCFSLASVTCSPICKKDVLGACHPVFNYEDEYDDTVSTILFYNLT